MSKGPALLLGLVLALAAAAVAALALAGRPSAGRQERAREFHRLVGGLGFGPTLDPGSCEFGFDPRLCPACPNDCGPIPGGMFFCPHHACSTLEYPSLPPRRDQGPADALLP